MRIRGLRPGRPSLRPGAAVLVGACVLGFVSHGLAEPSSKLPPGRRAAAPGGVVGVWEGGGNKLTVRRRDTVLTTCSTAAIPKPLAFALASPERGLAISSSGDSLVASLIDPASCRVLKQVVLGSGRSPLVSGLAREGWLIDISEQTLIRTGPDLADRVDVPRPSSPIAPTLSAANPAAGGQKPVLTKQGVWMFSAAAYAPQRLSGKAFQSLHVPACLRTEGVELRGHHYIRWIETTLSKAPADRAVYEGFLARARRGDTLFMGTVGALAADDSRVGVLVRVDGGRSCRLDIWDLARNELRSAQILPGVCPDALSLDGPHAWTAARGEWTRVALSTAPPACP